MSVDMNKYRRSATRIRKRGNTESKVIALVRKKGLLRARDFDAIGLPRMVLTRLCRSGHLRRAGRGLYVLPNADTTEHHALAEACKRIPRGIICLLSALRFHGLTTQAPFEVWIAIDVKSRKPQVDSMPLRVHRFSGAAMTSGVEEHDVEGVTVRVTSPAKTVADCFKYRNKIGLDVAVEALKDYRRARKSVDDLWRAAVVCRVTSVIRPYLEAIG